MLISRNPSRPGQISRIRLRRRKEIPVRPVDLRYDGSMHWRHPSISLGGRAQHIQSNRKSSAAGLGGCTPHRTSTVISKRVARQIATKAVIFVAASQNGSKDCNGAWVERGTTRGRNSRGHKRDSHRQVKQVAELTDIGEQKPRPKPGLSWVSQYEAPHPAADGRGGQARLNSDENDVRMGSRGRGREMTADTPREFERIHWLFREFRDAINRAGVGPHTAFDAVECTLEDLLADVCDSEEKLEEYFAALHDRTIRIWRRRAAA